MKKMFLLLILALFLAGCESGLFSSVRRALPEDANSIELELLAGRVEMVVGFDDMNGEHHQWKLACSVVAEWVTNADRREVYYNCSTEFDQFLLLKADGQGKYAIIYGPFGIPIFNNRE